jgi:hypothetical protein
MWNLTASGDQAVNSGGGSNRIRHLLRTTIMARMAVVLTSLALAGCGGTVMHPGLDTANGVRPVFLLEHGRHSSLVLTRADGSMVRYVYGDWHWYAKGETGMRRAVPTLFAATGSALGRQALTAPATETSIRRQVPMAIRNIHRLAAPAERIDGLDQRLQQSFEDLQEQSHYNAAYDLEFVPGQRPYTLFANSNHVVADWLRELGIDVRGNPVFGTWQVERDNDARGE